MNRVRAGIFSLTAVTPPDDDGSYLRWHLLDHLPEQYQRPGIVHGVRWIADGEYADHRLAGDGPLGEIGNAVHYLVGAPVRQTFDDFVALGRALRENGRMPVMRPLLEVAGLRLLQWQAAPRARVSHEVVPFRPHRGVLLIVEEPTDGRPDRWLEWLHAEHYPALLAVPGTAGAWTFGPTNAWDPLPADGGPTRSTSPSSISTTTRWPRRRPWRRLSKNAGDQPPCARCSPGRCGP
nr:hypothetical protein [Mycobacterium kansasii]